MADKKENRRYIAMVREVEGANGTFLKFVVQNPNPKNEDGTPNPYYRGSLVWVDAETGKKTVLASAGIGGVSDRAAAAGFTNSIYIDLDNPYHVIDPS